MAFSTSDTKQNQRKVVHNLSTYIQHDTNRNGEFILKFSKSWSVVISNHCIHANIRSNPLIPFHGITAVKPRYFRGIPRESDCVKYWHHCNTSRLIYFHEKIQFENYWQIIVHSAVVTLLYCILLCYIVTMLHFHLNWKYSCAKFFHSYRFPTEFLLQTTQQTRSNLPHV